jgi:uncharacterized protein YcfJ
MPPVRTLVILGLALTATACAVPGPLAPRVIALPPQGKDFAAFQREDAYCQQQAGFAAGVLDPNRAGNQVVGGAAVGALGGAAVGALLGAATGNAGAGAAIGAGTGLLAGTAIGANQAQLGPWEQQRRLDVTYAQCMASYGNAVQGGGVPVAGYAPPVVTYGFGIGTGGWGPAWGAGVGWGWGAW